MSLTTAAAGTRLPGNYRLPELPDPASRYLSPAKAHKMGDQVIAQLHAQGLILDDPELTTYIRSIGRRLAKHSTRAVQDFHFYVVDKNIINGFTLPGGYIGIDAGVLPHTDNESQLASVIAHESAHVTQHHVARQIAQSSGTGWENLAMMLAAALAGASAGSSDAVPAAMAGGLSHMAQQHTSWTRADEYEADRVGIRRLALAHYDPSAMAQFFKKLQRRAQLYGRHLPQILLTHPVATTRIAEAQMRAKDYPHTQVHTNPDYPLMKERARVLVSQHLNTLQRYYQRQLAAAHTPPAQYYGYALVLDRLGHARRAIALLKPRARSHPDRLPWTLALAHAEVDAHQIKAAQSLLSPALRRFPDSAALKLAYARVLGAENRPGAVRNFLLFQNSLLATMPQSQQLLAQAAAKQHHLGDAYYRRARFFAMWDDYPQAINQLRTALQTVNLNSYNRSRLTALRNQMSRACNVAWSTAKCRRAVATTSDQGAN